MQNSRERAVAYVVAALEAKGTATREDFDVHGIVATSHALIEDWDFATMEHATFWRIAASHLRV